MSDPAPPADAGGTAGRGAGPLTPARIDAVLADFRTWLERLAEPPPPPSEPAAPPVDLATLVGAFTALRHEVNLQTKAARVQAEQTAAALELLHRPTPPDAEAIQRPLLTTLIEAADALTRAEDGVRRAGVSVAVPWWKRPFVSEPLAALPSVADGLAMAGRRLEQALARHGLEPVVAVGQAFDPEVMEAVEAVADSGRPTGTVVAELRRGWQWRGRPFRVAQVTVAK